MSINREQVQESFLNSNEINSEYNEALGDYADVLDDRRALSDAVYEGLKKISEDFVKGCARTCSTSWPKLEMESGPLEINKELAEEEALIKKIQQEMQPKKVEISQSQREIADIKAFLSQQIF